MRLYEFLLSKDIEFTQIGIYVLWELYSEKQGKLSFEYFGHIR